MSFRERTSTAAALPMLPPVPVMTRTVPESLSDDHLVMSATSLGFV
jgi:hypothetical protein